MKMAMLTINNFNYRNVNTTVDETLLMEQITEYNLLVKPTKWSA